MPAYKYKAVTSQGKNLEGVYTGKDKQEVLSMLREKKHIPIKIEEVMEKKDIRELQLFNKVKSKDIAVFCRQFYTMLNSGVTIMTSLDVLRQQTENKKLRFVIGEVYEEVQKGLTFSEALKKYKATFPDLLIHMVEAGEVSGNLDTIMDRMATHYEKEYKINNKIQSAMVYPMLLSTVAVFVVIFLITFVMPTFMSMFAGSGVELPAPTRILLAISDVLQTYWYLFIVGFIFGILGIQKLAATQEGRFFFDQLKFKIPIIKGTTQMIATSRFTRTLATLLASGVPLLQAMEIVSRVVGNHVVAKGINRAKEEVRRGASLAQPIKDLNVFPPMVTSMIQIGEESGSLDEILEKTANFYDEELEVSLQKLTTMIEPLMIIVMATVIGFIVISMVLPMFDMMNTVNM